MLGSAKSSDEKMEVKMEMEKEEKVVSCVYCGRVFTMLADQSSRNRNPLAHQPPYWKL
jgi:hypothetical protein